MSRAAVPALVAVAALLIYPLAVLAHGSPRFPSRGECIRPATEGDTNIEAVFGRFARKDEAAAMLARVLKAGFVGSKAENDGCGRLKVDVQGVPSVDVGKKLAAEAHTVGLQVTLERATP